MKIKGYRKLIMGFAGMSIIATLGFFKDVVCEAVIWGIVAIVGLFCGGNSFEHFDKRKEEWRNK